MSNIVISRNNELKYLYATRQNGLRIKNIISGRFKNNSVILPGIGSDFDAIINQSGNIEIICQDKEHNLVYLNENNNGFSKEYLLKAKEGNNVNIHGFRLISINSLVIAFYCLDYDDRVMLCKHILNNGGSPEPIEYLNKKHREFTLCKSRSGDIHIFYFSEESGFGTRVYKWSRKSFGDFVKLSERTDISAVYEHNGIHICSSESRGVFYRKFSEESNQWEDAKLLTKQRNELKSCVIYGESNKLHICWENTGQLYSTVSGDGGDTWSRLKETKTPSGFLCEKVKLLNGNKEMYAYCYTANNSIQFPTGREFLNSKSEPVMRYDLKATAAYPHTVAGVPEKYTDFGVAAPKSENFFKAEMPVPKAEVPFESKTPAPKAENKPIIAPDSGKTESVHLADSIEMLAAAINNAIPNRKLTRSRQPRKKAALVTLHKK